VKRPTRKPLKGGTSLAISRAQNTNGAKPQAPKKQTIAERKERTKHLKEVTTNQTLKKKAEPYREQNRKGNINSDHNFVNKRSKKKPKKEEKEANKKDT